MSRFGNPASIEAAPGQVLLEIDAAHGVAEIILNRPEKHNALSVPMRDRISELIRECEAAPEVRVIILRGNGKSFCSGNEINEDWGQRAPGKKRFTLTDAVRYGTDMTYGRRGFSQAISRCEKVTLLEMHGYCAAAAYFMIATHCDLVVATADAKVGAIEGRFLGPAGAVSHIHLNRILGTKAARRIGWTAEPVSGLEMQRLGLVTRCVADGADLRTESLTLARQVAAMPPRLLGFLKARIRAGEALLGASMPGMPGLLVSHFLQADKDELDFWQAVRAGGVSAALHADKSRKQDANERSAHDQA